MAYVIFERHPGDLLTIKNKEIDIQLKSFTLRLEKPIKFTRDGYTVFFHQPARHLREQLIEILFDMQLSGEILKYVI